MSPKPFLLHHHIHTQWWNVTRCIYSNIVLKDNLEAVYLHFTGIFSFQATLLLLFFKTESCSCGTYPCPGPSWDCKQGISGVYFISARLKQPSSQSKTQSRISLRRIMSRQTVLFPYLYILISVSYSKTCTTFSTSLTDLHNPADKRIFTLLNLNKYSVYYSGLSRWHWGPPTAD